MTSFLQQLGELPERKKDTSWEAYQVKIVAIIRMLSLEEKSIYEQYPLLWHLCSFLGSNPDYKPEIVTYPYVDFGKQEHTDNIQLILIYSECEFWVFAVTYFIFLY